MFKKQKFNECTRSAEPLPQMWFGKQLENDSGKQLEKIFECNNPYYSYYTEIILYLCVCALQVTLQVQLAI